MKAGTIFVALVALALAAGTFAARAAVDETKALPDDPAKTLVLQNCTICHSSTMITTQRLSEKAWTAELVKMEGWGAPLAASNNATVAAYLAKYFNPDIPDLPPVFVKSPKAPG
jgi:mono/diheme cytochrome c family protein